jgi:hypothetical protein
MGCRNRKRPTLGDKEDLFQEKGDKSITLAKYIAIAMPVISIYVFFIKTQHGRGLGSFPIFFRQSAGVQFFVLLGHFTNHKWAHTPFMQ